MGNSTSENSTDPDDYFYDSINTSDKEFISTIWRVQPASQIIIETTIFLPIVLFGIFGNVLSIYILAKNRHIRTPTNLLIGNMAAADLLSLLTHPWVILVYDLFQNYELGAFGCKSEGAFECSSLIASVVSVSVISYDRLTAVVIPRDHRLTKRSAKIVMGLSWVAGVLISAPLFIYRLYKERVWKDFVEKYCKENSVIINTYWYVIVSVMVWLPLTIQLICYIAIFIKLNKYEKVVLRKLEHRQVNYKKKAIRMMFTVIVTFMVCRIPFTALILYRHESVKNNNIDYFSPVTEKYHTFWFISKYMMFVNAALNPLIYSVTNQKFRRGFRTTQISKWLFPPQRSDVALLQRTKATQKTPAAPPHQDNTSFLRTNLFFIFNRKQKIKDNNNTETMNGDVQNKEQNPNIHI